MSFVSLQIPDDWSQQVFYARILSSVVRYDLIYHLFPINSQYSGQVIPVFAYS